MTDDITLPTIEAVVYDELGQIRAVIDGRELTVPDVPGNRHRRMIAAWEDAGNVIAPHVPPAPTEADVRAEAARRLEAMARPYSAAERETWSLQTEEARAVKGGAQTAALLAPLAAARGLTLAEMADLVAQRRDAFVAGAAAILAAQAMLLARDPIPADYADDSHWPTPGSGGAR